MALVGRWKKDNYCPNCYNVGDNFWWIVDTFYCSKCKWSGTKEELLTKKQIRVKKLLKMYDKKKSIEEKYKKLIKYKLKKLVI